MPDDRAAPLPPGAAPLAPRGLLLPWREVDVVGDVHGCVTELVALLGRLGYAPDAGGAWRHGAGRRLVFVGDLANRGPDTLGALDLVAATVAGGGALAVLGNHDHHLLRWLRGAIEPRDDDLGATAARYAALPDAERAASLARHRALLESAPLWALLDPAAPDERGGAEAERRATPLARDEEEGGGIAAAPEEGALWRAARLAVAHAAWRPEVVGADEERALPWCLYGPSAGRDANDRPVRLDWPRFYPADAPRCVVGHTAYDGPVVWHGRTLCIDTGCAYGGRLSALRWPERSLVQEPARRTWHHHPAIGPSPGLRDPAAIGPEAVALARWGTA